MYGGSVRRGVSIHTLHYYDEIGLPKPASYSQNGYRKCGEEELLQLQQILFFRQQDFSLNEIREFTSRPDSDVLHALQVHRTALKDRVKRLDRPIITIDMTIMQMKGKPEMNPRELFEGFNSKKQKQYAQEIRERYGSKTVEESEKRWKSYDSEKKVAIKAEGEAILVAILTNMEKGYDSPQIQQQIAALHEFMGNFYDCSYDHFMGLGKLYREHPDFVAMYKKHRPYLPEFLFQAISYYCKDVVDKRF